MSTYSFKGNKRFWNPRDEDENRKDCSGIKKEKDVPITCSLKQVISNVKMCTEKWATDKIIRLLRLYGGHKCLWDMRNEDFRNKSLRKAALIDISAAMGAGMTPAKIMQKINVLRATYRYEKRRIKMRMRKIIEASGIRSAPEIQPTTKLKWFALADSFLRDVPRIGKIRKNANNSESNSELEQEMVLTIDPEAIIPFEIEQFNKTEAKCVSKVEDELCNTGNLKAKSNKTKWTMEKSLKFVELLKDQPVLWSNTLLKTQEAETKALEMIGLQLNVSSCRIKRRVEIFKETWKNEILKINENSNYKPPYIWWSLAVSFMPCSYEHLEFIDANALIPPTPLQIFDSPQTLLTPINPIPSVSVSSVLAEGDNDFEEITEKNVEPENNFETNLNIKSSMETPEDDLLDGKWSLKHSVKFLRLYGSHRCLWDLTDSDYRLREQRAAAIEDIAAAMGHGLDANYVAKKIKIFRITYMQHRKRMLAAIKSGQEPEIQLRWFPLADSFLRPHIGLRSIKEQEREIPQFDYHYVMANLNLIDPELLNDFREKSTVLKKNAENLHTLMRRVENKSDSSIF